MVWTYTGDPSNSERDAVRFHMQDTDVEDPLYQDEEIDYMLTQHGGVIPTAIAMLRRLLVRFARHPDIRMGETWIYDSDRHTMLKAALDALLTSRGAAAPFAGGLYKTEFEPPVTDSIYEEPAFRRDPAWTKDQVKL